MKTFCMTKSPINKGSRETINWLNMLRHYSQRSNFFNMQTTFTNLQGKKDSKWRQYMNSLSTEKEMKNKL